MKRGSAGCKATANRHVSEQQTDGLRNAPASSFNIQPRTVTKKKSGQPQVNHSFAAETPEQLLANDFGHLTNLAGITPFVVVPGNKLDKG